MKHYGWSFDQAYEEMKKYDFYTRSAGDLKDFVKDYAVSFCKKATRTTVDTPAPSVDEAEPRLLASLLKWGVNEPDGTRLSLEHPGYFPIHQSPHLLPQTHKSSRPTPGQLS